jgi:sarcosine oxidase
VVQCAYDAIVLGLGGMGSASLAHLAARGQRVLGLEQFSPTHAIGSSHGGSRIIRQAYFEHPDYVPLLLRAYELWAELEQRTGRRLFQKCGGLFAGHPAAEVVQGSIASARTYGLPHESLTAPEIRQRFPAMRPLDDEVAVYEPNAGVLFPEECVLAHLQAAVAAGAEARFGVRVEGWSPTSAGGVRVSTSEGEIEAGRLVVTAGAWLGSAAADMALPLRVERNVMHWFEPAGNAAQVDPAHFPVYLLQRKGERVLYGFPALPGHGLKAAFHGSGDVTTPAQLNRQVSAEEVAEIRHALGGWLPEAVGAWRQSAACMYTLTPDEHFAIGLHPAHPQVIVAGGFSGHGFKFCSVVGEMVADFAVAGATALPAALFAPDRFAR